MKEAGFYTGAEDRAVQCHLCSHRCRIAEGTRGLCSVRENRDGTLYTLSYGRITAAQADPIEKKPLYHFAPGTLAYSIATPGCNFRCGFCQNWQISQIDGAEPLLAIKEVAPESVVMTARSMNCQSVCYTYTEPTIFMEYALDCAALAREAGLKNVFVTNGYETPEAVEAMVGLIDAANVDLKAFSSDFYRKQCGAKLEFVLEAIRLMWDVGIHVEVTTLVVPDLNDGEDELRSIAGFLSDISPDLPWHVSAFHPDYKAQDVQPTPPITIRGAMDIGREEGLHYVYAGNVLIDGARDTSCAACGATVIRRSSPAAVEVLLRGNQCPECGAKVPVVTASEAPRRGG